MFYKISDKQTLEYVEKIGGKEAVTAFGLNQDGDYRITQQLEDVMNATRIRALPRQGVGIVIAEQMNEPIVVRTNFVAVSQEFDWDKYEFPEDKDLFAGIDDTVIKEDQVSDDEKLEKFKISMEKTELLENSDIFGISYTSEAI